MFEGTTALQPNIANAPIPAGDYYQDAEWTLDQHSYIAQALQQYGCSYLKGRDEYTLLKEVMLPNVTQVSDPGKPAAPENPLKKKKKCSGVISPLCHAIRANDTDTSSYPGAATDERSVPAGQSTGLSCRPCTCRDKRTAPDNTEPVLLSYPAIVHPLPGKSQDH